MPPPFNFSASVLNNFQFLLEHILADLASVGGPEGLGFRFSRVRLLCTFPQSAHLIRPRNKFLEVWCFGSKLLVVLAALLSPLKLRRADCWLRKQPFQRHWLAGLDWALALP